MNSAPTSKAKLHILCGIPGCGKSTYARNLEGNVVSSDKLREDYCKGDATDQSKNELVFRSFHHMLRFGLENGHDMIADSTALDAHARTTLRQIAYVAEAEAHLHLFRNLNEAISRNRLRERRVPDDVMMRMVEKYERTALVLPQEHYDSVTEIRSFR